MLRYVKMRAVSTQIEHNSNIYSCAVSFHVRGINIPHERICFVICLNNVSRRFLFALCTYMYMYALMILWYVIPFYVSNRHGQTAMYT